MKFRVIVIGIALVGSGLVVYGTGLIYRPAAFILAGLTLVGIACGLVGFMPTK